ncbi:hypothetical protein [Microbacterium azadirachtae]|uniref:Uncharacterized protein n=1 Tax=Microbacterium azadirachtae TaxID=582680 RepID=A0A0F0KN85_9MICO|nr:hypothetical protein [Microbacterium azadirachtae]KJL21605.1 hypothetical protein RL72_02567 [Microbacterium azadirachtae]UXW84918.1 hypothetical protein NFX31_11890 [Microbacterium azadirachtae]SDM02823.1 hypothetical protein SAMN04488593_2391 [Microbacterium azadirachtae]SEG28375.1 hypothetical protein SAMN04488594_2377 [Microbacterium azadirachtae]SEG31381.1 hypothetical protein SAMN04488592_2388 [Microbacterium azadirachtae]
MAAPSGFSYSLRGDDVVIAHRGVTAAVLRGRRAVEFLDQVQTEEPQLLMARITGNYRRGNERAARRHPRNAG